MATVAMPVTNKISIVSDLEVKFRKLSVSYGDGYEQTAPDGINNTFDVWNLTWGGLSSTERNTVMTALRSVGTWGTLTWTPCDETVQKKYQIEGSIKSTREGAFYRVSCQVKQVFRI